MTTSEMLLLEMLKATTLALRVVLGHIEAPYIITAREITTSIMTDSAYRGLDGAQRAAMADAGTAVMGAVGHTKGLK